MAARGILSADPAVRSVRGVTVHYQDTVFVRVDANICVDPNFTVSEASSLAVKLRENLESSNEINQANIFLDLNAETLFGTIHESGAFQ
jgi:divalent metal cation (Fe/Co/Zn/Cd) transporter